MTKVFEAVTSRQWLITPEYLNLILNIINRESPLSDSKALQTEMGTPLEGTKVTIRDGVAIVPIIGPIVKRANFFSRVSGMTSTQLLMQDFHKALNSAEVSAIILDIDSPGGEANGIHEFADAIYAAREKKPIYAYIGGIGASAAYWIATAASEVFIDRTAVVGSIGVVAAYVDDSERRQKAGLKDVEIVSTTSPKKRPDLNSDEGRAQILARLDALQEVFVASVARNRGVSTETVLADFGQGDVLVGEAAVAAGMADELGNLEGVINMLSQQSQPKGVIMSTDAKTYAPGDITLEVIKKDFPQLAAQLQAEGAEKERDRIKAIHALSRPGAEDIVKKAMFESDENAGDVAIAILEANKKRTANVNGQVEDDAAEVPPLGAPVTDAETDDAAEQKELDKFVVEGGNQRRALPAAR